MFNSIHLKWSPKPCLILAKESRPPAWGSRQPVSIALEYCLSTCAKSAFYDSTSRRAFPIIPFPNLDRNRQPNSMFRISSCLLLGSPTKEYTEKLENNLDNIFFDPCFRILMSSGIDPLWAISTWFLLDLLLFRITNYTFLFQIVSQ